MISKFAIYLIVVTFLFLNGCSQIVNKISSKPRPTALKVLEPVKPSIKNTVSWQVNTDSMMGENKVHPLIDKDVIYVAGGISASALRKTDGKTIWKTIIGETISAGVNGDFNQNQISKTSTQIFIGTTRGNAIALDANTGKVQWIERLSSEIQAISASHDNRVTFRTVDSKIHGLSSSTGELIWQRSQPAVSLTQFGTSVPVIVPPLVIAGFDNGKVSAYDLKTGRDIWEVTLALPRGFTDLDRRVDIDGKIKPLGNALFATSLNGNTSGVNMESGKQVWARAFSSSEGVNANPTGLYSSDDKGIVWKFDPQTGDPVWSQDDLQRRLPTVPALLGNSLIVLGDKEGNLHWINSTNGEFAYRIKGDKAGYSVEPEISNRSVYAIGKSGVVTKINLQ